MTLTITLDDDVYNRIMELKDVIISARNRRVLTLGDKVVFAIMYGEPQEEENMDENYEVLKRSIERLEYYYKSLKRTVDRISDKIYQERLTDEIEKKVNEVYKECEEYEEFLNLEEELVDEVNPRSLV